VRILTVSNLYPSEAKPVHGVFVEERMTRYAARFGADLRVVAPVPWFPFKHGFGEYSRIARTPREETRKGIKILHPRVPIIPKIGMRLAPQAWRWRLRPLIQQIAGDWKFDLLDVHYIYPDAVALVPLARELGVPVVVSARGTDVHLIGNIRGPRERIRRACIDASAVIAVSSALAKHLVEIGVPERNITVVCNGADVEAFAPRPGAAAKKLASGRVLLGVGRLVPQKGFHIAIECVARLLPKYPDLNLVLAGSGAERGRLERQAADLGIGDRVRFLGEVIHDKIPELLWGSDRLLLPSFREGHPNAVVEAVAAGVPVVATAIGGIPEIVEPAIGEIAERPEVGAFERALDRSLARKFDSAEFDRRREGLRWDRSLDLLHQVFERAVAPAPAQS
jgi:glycosyltransferase involved in cell wall biosynthesis